MSVRFDVSWLFDIMFTTSEYVLLNERKAIP